MAEDTQNPATQVSSGIGSVVNGIWGALTSSAKTWRGLIALTLILAFILAYQYQGRQLTPADNSQVLSALSNIRKDVSDLRADLKGSIAAGVSEISEKLETIKAPPPVSAKIQRVKKIQAATGDPKE